MDDKTVAGAVLEASRINNINIEKLVKKQSWTNKLLLFLIAMIPLTTWFDNRGVLTVLVQETGWLNLFVYGLIGVGVVALAMQGAKFIKK